MLDNINPAYLYLAGTAAAIGYGLPLVLIIVLVFVSLHEMATQGDAARRRKIAEERLVAAMEEQARDGRLTVLTTDEGE